LKKVELQLWTISSIIQIEKKLNTIMIIVISGVGNMLIRITHVKKTLKNPMKLDFFINNPV
jgi:hypothetical protein